MTKKEIEEAMEKAVNDKIIEEKKDGEKKELEKQNADEKKDETKQDNEIELKKTIEELTDTLKRVQAEFINYKNRVEKEKLFCIEYANADLIKKLLPVLDSFDLALQNTIDFEKFKKGMEMVYAQLWDVLEHEGLRKIDCKGKFDPYKHEVLMKVFSDKEEDEILQELQKGYILKDKVLRHSKVKVSAGKNSEENQKNNEQNDEK